MNQLANSSVYILPGVKPPIIGYIMTLLGTSEEALKQRNRKREMSDKRQLAMYLIYRTCRRSSIRVGEMVARDHATVLHACKQIENRAFWDVKFKQRLSELLEKIKNYDLSN